MDALPCKICIDCLRGIRSYYFRVRPGKDAAAYRLFGQDHPVYFNSEPVYGAYIPKKWKLYLSEKISRPVPEWWYPRASVQGMTKEIRKGKKKNSAEIANAEKSDSCGILPFLSTRQIRPINRQPCSFVMRKYRHLQSYYLISSILHAYSCPASCKSVFASGSVFPTRAGIFSGISAWTEMIPNIAGNSPAKRNTAQHFVFIDIFFWFMIAPILSWSNPLKNPVPNMADGVIRQ